MSKKYETIKYCISAICITLVVLSVVSLDAYLNILSNEQLLIVLGGGLTAISYHHVKREREKKDE